MTANWRQWFGTVSLAISLLLSGTVMEGKERAMASIVPDDTLGAERSTIHPLGPHRDRIEGGALRGSSLFHSFRDFNIGEGRGAYFTNPAAVENIFSRVTGSNPSHLFGTLGVLGEANLFFLNPNGILFGPNFNLDLRGSFVATTANSIAFPDGNLFSASDPQAPPLLTVNVTAPIGLRFEGASPGAIVNAGNLTVDEGQNLTLAAGTVASTGLLAAPGGEVAVVTVPGAVADGIPTVQLAEAGQFLGLAMEPLALADPPNAPSGLSLPELLGDAAIPGLAVNAAGEVELATVLAVEAGDATVQQLRARAATLSAAGNLTLVESHLGTTGDLQLLAKDTVRVRDSAANPFIAAAGGELVVQGDRNVDIFALNHANSGLFSGGDMTLRSADAVNGDVHYWSGGSFQIEQLDGSPGSLFSPHDPIIRSQGDVRFNTYVGSSLHILTGGEVDIGSVIIRGTDTLADSINPTATPALANVTLSDGTPLVIDGNAQPTLDIRAGMDPVAIGGPLGTSGANFPTDLFLQPLGPFLFLVSPPASNPAATSANLTIGEVRIDAFDGLVFLSNQYQPNLSLPGGDITVTGAGVFGVGGINANGSGGMGGSVIIDSRRDIQLNNSFITSAADVGDAGEIALIADREIALTNTSRISSSTFGLGKSGDINITATSLSLNQGSQISASTSGAGRGGNLMVDAVESVRLIDTSVDGQFPSGLFARSEGKGTAGDLIISTQQLLVHGGAQVSAETFGDGAGGNLTVNAADWVQLIGTSPDSRANSGLFTQAAGKGAAGSLTIDTRQLLIQDGAQVLTGTRGDGAGGNLTANAADWVQLIGISPDGQRSSGLLAGTEGKGDAGSLTINTRKLLVRDGAQISTSTRGDGTGGTLSANAADWVELIGTSPDGQAASGLVTVARGKGNAGSLIVDTRELLVQDGAGISTSTFGDGVGGSLSVGAVESVRLIGTSFDGQRISGLFAETQSKGDAGNLAIDTRQLLVQGGAAISASTSGDGAGGNLTADVADWVQLVGTSPDGQRNSGLFADTQGKGNAGNLTINTRRLLLRDGAQASAGTVGDGVGGRLNVNAADWVQLIGTSPDGQRSSRLFAQTEGESNAGSLTINTRKLLLRDGAQVSTGTVGDGTGGSLSANVTELVELIGASPDGQFPSGLFTATLGKGAAGTLIIDTQKLLVRDGALVSAGTAGNGAGGNLSVNAADWVELIGTSPDGQRNSGLLTRTSGKGNAGSLTIDTRQLLVRDGALVSTSTVGDGAGGRLNVNAADWVQLIGTSPDGQRNNGLLTRTSGKGNAGSLTIDTRQLLVRDGALVSTGTVGDGAGGRLNVNAADWVQLIGTSPDGRRISGLFAQSAGQGDAGSLIVDTQQLLVRDGAQVSASTVGNGAGGNLSVNAADWVQLIGTSPDSQFSSGLLTATEGKGNAGSLIINTRQLLVRDGAQVSASTADDGFGGNLSATATDWIQLIGTSPDGQLNSGLFAITAGKGNAGNLTIDTRQLLVRDSAQVSAGTAGSGVGGSLSVTATDWVQLIGTFPGSQSSGLFASTLGEGRGGNLNITTRALMLQDGARASVSGTTAGDAGDLGITARSIFLNNGASITAETASGEGGNIMLKVSDLLLLRRGSQISTTAGTAQSGGDGGNITIDAGFVVAVPGENSDIFANAFTGRGGNINITANGIFGLEFRPFLTELSDITASSQFGVDGTVQLNTLGIDPSRGLGLLPEEPTTLQVAASCRTRGGEAAVEFFDVGSGGLPPRPDEPLGNAIVIADLIPLDDGIEALTDSAVGEPLISPFSIDASEGIDAAARWVFCQQAAASL